MLTTLGNGKVLANPSRDWLLWFRQGIPSQGNTLLHQAGSVEQTVQTLGESLARQSRAKPMRPKGKLSLGSRGHLGSQGLAAFCLRKITLQSWHLKETR